LLGTFIHKTKKTRPSRPLDVFQIPVGFGTRPAVSQAKARGLKSGETAFLSGNCFEAEVSEQLYCIHKHGKNDLRYTSEGRAPFPASPKTQGGRGAVNNLKD
jgi:hypothetical protein